MSEADQRGSQASKEAHNNSRELKERTENSISWVCDSENVFFITHAGTGDKMSK